MRFPIPVFTMIEIPDFVLWYFITGIFFMFPSFVMNKKECDRDFGGSKALLVIATLFCVVVWPLTALIMAHDLIFEWELKEKSKGGL